MASGPDPKRMNISSVGPPIIALVGAQGPSAAAAQIASSVARGSADSSIPQELELAVLGKALAAETLEAVDLDV
jgi:hypothetical protein